MDLEDIRKILRLLKNTDIAEFSYEKDGEKIKIKRGKVSPAVSYDIPAEEPGTAVAPRPHAAGQQPAAPAEGEAHGLFTVTSPIVGTFYRSPSPEAPSFVEPGSPVKKGQVLCIIEAMKLMNEIESEVDGIMVRALVENGQPVEYGEPLFLVKPN